VAIGPNSSWVVIAGPNRFSSAAVPAAMQSNLTTIETGTTTVTGVALGLTGSYAITYGTNASYVTATRAARAR